MSGLYRAAVVVALALVALGATLVSAGAAWSAPIRASAPYLTYNSALQALQLRIPTPVCPGSAVDCQWMLWVNEPQVAGKPIVGEVTGTSGTLSVNIPNFCGTVQADALIGPAPWIFARGIRRHFDSCTTGGASPTTGVQAVAATSGLPFTGDSTTPQAVAAAAVTPASQLPFTGVDLRPLIILGSALILLGGSLLSTVESRRRMLRRASAIRLVDVKDGAHRASSWFLGL
jgi:hypothetical protein